MSPVVIEGLSVMLYNNEQYKYSRSILANISRIEALKMHPKFQ